MESLTEYACTVLEPYAGSAINSSYDSGKSNKPKGDHIWYIVSLIKCIANHMKKKGIMFQ